MRKFTAASAFALCMSAIAASAPAHAITIESTTTYNGHTYLLLSSDTWTASEAFAQTLGGHLVTINNATEDSWIYSTFAVPGKLNIWTGLSDAGHEGKFTWSSGEAFTYSNFAYVGPSGGYTGGMPENYVHLWYPTSGWDGRWNDYPNFASLYSVPIKGVVELENGLPVPEPMAMTLLGAGLLGLSTLRRRKAV